MRCPDCNKFVSMDSDVDPEAEDPEIDAASNSATASVRIVNACADCGTELKDATLELEFTLDDADKHDEEGHELEGEIECDRTSRSTGKGRGTRTFYGVDAKLTVTCSCGWTCEATTSEEVQASSMDECC